MTTTWTMVSNLAVELAAVPADTRTIILAIVDTMIDVGLWGEQADYAGALLAAHIATITWTRRGRGQITSEAVGSISASYATLSDVKGTLGESSYGALLLLMLEALPDAMGFVAPGC